MSGVKMWVDDERTPPEGWDWFKSAGDAIAALDNRPPYAVISLDYSLGGISDWDNNGGEVLKWLKDHPEKWPTEEIRAHSGSAGGRDCIVDMAEHFKPAGWTGTITNTGGF